MKHTFRDDGQVKQHVVRDAHAPDTIYIHTELDNQRTLEHNRKVQNAEVVKQDFRSPLVDGDVIAFAFQFPSSMDYMICKRKEPELFARIEAGGDDGVRAAETLAILYPEFVLTTKRGDARRMPHARKTLP